MPESMSIKFKEIVPYSSLFIFCIHLLLKYLFAITSAAVVLLSIIVFDHKEQNNAIQYYKMLPHNVLLFFATKT